MEKQQCGYEKQKGITRKVILQDQGKDVKDKEVRDSPAIEGRTLHSSGLEEKDRGITADTDTEVQLRGQQRI